MQLSLRGEKSSTCAYSVSGFHFYQVEIQLSFQLRPLLNGKVGDLVFFPAFVLTGLAALLGLSGCSQQVGTDHANLLSRGLALQRLNHHEVIGRQW